MLRRSNQATALKKLKLIFQLVGIFWLAFVLLWGGKDFKAKKKRWLQTERMVKWWIIYFSDDEWWETPLNFYFFLNPILNNSNLYNHNLQSSNSKMNGIKFDLKIFDYDRERFAMHIELLYCTVSEKNMVNQFSRLFTIKCHREGAIDISITTRIK